jgi:catechol 2,3-dioxygenase-like lactoylglutathione lyase family enzyme
MAFNVTAFGHTGITVVDMDTSLAFWRDLLGFKEILNAELDGDFASQITGVEGTDIHFVILEGPGHSIELVQYRGPEERQHLRPRPSDVGSLHVALIVDSIDGILDAAALHGWQAPGNAQTVDDGPFAGTSFVYMYGPDGTVVELIEPPVNALAGSSGH